MTVAITPRCGSMVMFAVGSASSSSRISPTLARCSTFAWQGSLAMRRTFQPADFVTEAHYREAWPAEGGAVFGSVADAILRRDWQSGTTTLSTGMTFPAVGLHRS